MAVRSWDLVLTTSSLFCPESPAFFCPGTELSDEDALNMEAKCEEENRCKETKTSTPRANIASTGTYNDY